MRARLVKWNLLLQNAYSFLMPSLSYRRIDLATDAAMVYRHYCETCTLSYGPEHRPISLDRHHGWLAGRIEEFPDGHVLAMLGTQVVGQLELQVPYGLKTGYVNLFYVTRPFRRLGFGRELHEFAERYFKSWDADTIELHVARTNEPALTFYRSLGYRSVPAEAAQEGMILMRRGVGVRSIQSSV